MKTRLSMAGILAFVCITLGAQAQEASPVAISPGVQAANGERELILEFHLPAHCHIYADRLSVEIAGKPAHVKFPEPLMLLDKLSGRNRGMYGKDFAAAIALEQGGGEVALAVNLQACNETECYFPETRRWTIHSDGSISPVLELGNADKAPGWQGILLSGFTVKQHATGYLGRSAFLAFLDRSLGRGSAEETGLFAGLGVMATIGLILLGGMALNLTPCVLPMIPINLAILGAGVKSGNRRRSVALGGAYGLGMAAAYGALGLIVVLTGSKFGALNSSPWFNFGIAIVFIFLGAAMFDKFSIDFSRFQRGGSHKQGTRSAAFVGAAIMGAVSALLAGACVAPVVISVLLLATTSYQRGNLAGLLFPFVLGLGMALPWPFAAGGLSFLPKPGKWMTRVKHGFGVLIFAFAVWYGWLGWNLTRMESMTARARQKNHGADDLRAALAASRENGKPVLVDFWASWCKNCEAMEHTTLRDAEVRKRLENFSVVHFEAEQLDDPAVKPTLDEFGVLGLPTFIVVEPGPPSAPGSEQR